MRFRNIRSAPAAEWAELDIVLPLGAMGIEEGTNNFKLGDGVSHWNALPYSNAAAENIVPLLVQGTTDTYELPQAPNPPSSLRLYNGGERMTLNVDYTLNGNRYQYVPEQMARGNQCADYRY